MIAALEEISLNALPALQTFLYDGWVLRFSNGYTRRANSVQPLYLPKRPLAEKIAYCESLYSRRNMPTIFKMTPGSQPPELDQELEKRGYVYEADTRVQTCALQGLVTTAEPHVEISERWNEEWFAEFARLNNYTSRSGATLKQMLGVIVPQTAFALLRGNDGVCACGLAVLQETHVGLFDVIVDSQTRRRGYGKQIVTQLMAWGKQRGAHTAYLQVVAQNEPARSLYAGLGFVDQYPYWYRVRF